MSLQATSKQTSIVAPMIHHLSPPALRQMWITCDGHVFVSFGSWRSKPVGMLVSADCWILWSLEGMTILWNLPVYQCFCVINWTHLQGIHLQNGPVYLEEEGSMFHWNTGIFRYPYVVIPEQRASNFMTSEFFTAVSFTKVPYFLEIYIQTKCHILYHTQRFVFLASHTFISKQRWYYMA